MDLEFVVTRLKAQTTGLRAIGGAADFDAALNGNVVLPALYVIPLGDSADWMGHTGSYDETENIDFGVVIGVANLKDVRGEAAQTTLAPVRRQVRQALAGWAPDDNTGEPIRKTSGRLLRMDGDGRLWWMDRFQLKTYFRSDL